ncbi:MAG: ATPase [Bacteroidetes bacterium]|nr:MAG: ATPase [Bacteroidota bacterium]
MKFYNREHELDLLRLQEDRMSNSSRMTVIIGRRRIGKTRLILKSLNTNRDLYFFTAKKSERMLCEEFIEEVRSKGIPVFGQIHKFKDLFELLLNASKQNPFTLVIDEFQEFYSINPSVFSDMQNLWDRYKDESQLNLILSGSIYTMMKKIFENANEPLFGRADEKIYLKAFDVDTLKRIIADHFPKYKAKDLLSFYTYTGGVAKYVEILSEKNALSYTKMRNEFFKTNSYFLEEGKNMLIEEFGKEYTTYFSILSLIASSKTSRTEMESILEKNIGGYLDKLEKEYSLIKKVKPIMAKPGSRTQKYLIHDNFLNFWFRFVFKYKSAVEIQNFDYLRKIVDRDFDTYSGRILEKYFIEKLSREGKYNEIGTYWEKGNRNEIDIVAIDSLNKIVLFADVKLQKKKINIELLKIKSQKLLHHFNGFTFEYKGLSVLDM